MRPPGALRRLRADRHLHAFPNAALPCTVLGCWDQIGTGLLQHYLAKGEDDKMVKSVLRLILLVAATSGAAHAADKVVVTPVVKATTTVSGQPILLPKENPEVTVSIYEIAPGAALPQHRHLYPRYGYVLSGKLRVTNVETGKVTNLDAGGFIVEALDQWHFGDNPGTELLRLLVIDQAPAGVKNVELKN
jgi:quercetin dioxygenase-like cupin family protein